MRESYYDEYAKVGSHWWFEARGVILNALLEQTLPPSSDRRVLDLGADRR